MYVKFNHSIFLEETLQRVFEQNVQNQRQNTKGEKTKVLLVGLETTWDGVTKKVLQHLNLNLIQMTGWCNELLAQPIKIQISLWLCNNDLLNFEVPPFSIKLVQTGMEEVHSHVVAEFFIQAKSNKITIIYSHLTFITQVKYIWNIKVLFCGYILFNFIVQSTLKYQ